MGRSVEGPHSVPFRLLVLMLVVSSITTRLEFLRYVLTHARFAAATAPNKLVSQ